MDSFTDYESFDGLGLAKLVKSGVVTQDELLNAAIERIEQRNPKLNAVIYKMYEQARSSLSHVNKEGMFQGVPFLLKDLLADYSGVPMQFGSRMMSNYVSPCDSELVKHFKKAGLIIVGKTNTPEFGLNSTTEPELFGPTLNPWDVTKSSGGSSGGSAVAVASGMVPMAHGGDGAGSLRVPAAYCGIFALKPSRGRTPTGPNIMRIWQGMVTEHILSRSVRDSAAMLDVLSGSELGSLISLPKPKEPFLEALNQAPPPLRIAVCDKPFFPGTTNAEYSAAIQKAATLCQTLGHQIEVTSFSINGQEAAYAFMIVIAAETAATINLFSEYLKDKVDQRALEVTTAVLCEVGKKFSAADFAWACEILDRLTRQSAEFFQNYDILLTPTTAAPPPNIGKLKPDWVEKNMLELLRRVPIAPLLRKMMKSRAAKFFELIPFTPLFNITGQPAMSVPLFWDKHGLPIGIQFAGRFMEEKTLLQLAQQLEEAQPWFNKRPNLTQAAVRNQIDSGFKENSIETII